MAKPHITVAAVTAAHDVFDGYGVPAHYFTSSSAEQRRIRMALVRQALIAAWLADHSAEATTSEGRADHSSHPPTEKDEDATGLLDRLGEVAAKSRQVAEDAHAEFARTFTLGSTKDAAP